MAKLKYIHRKEEFKVGLYWLVIIDIAPKKYVKTFSDSNYGSKEAALEKAIQFRDKIVQKEGLILVEDRQVHNNKKSTNTSGVNGVSKSTGIYYAYIQVSPYKRKCRKFSIAKYGEEVAFRKAVAWRKGMELIVYGHSRIKDSQF